MAGEKTTTIKRTVAPPASKVTKGKQQDKRKYRNDDAKCSVDVGAKNRGALSGDEGLIKKGPAKAATFQSGKNKNMAKSLTDVPKDARARACAHWMEEAIQLTLKGIRKEFVANVKGYIPPGTNEACVENPSLNRYDDVICLESSRVKLKNAPDGIDYIHASYVKVHPDLVYICAQGPLSNSVEHFWIMIIQEETKVVLQLCQLMEDGKEKCNEYYPPAAEGSDWKSYGCVSVRVTERNSNPAGMKKVIKSKMQVKMDGNKDKVYDLTHIFFHGWPDHGVAESVGTVKEVRSLVHRYYEKKPIVAHCSAGIGRTGTFVMIELVCYRLLTKHDADFKMYAVAQELRDQRMHALQNDQQYVFVYRCVLDVLLAEDALPKSPEVTKFIDDYDSLIDRKKKERKKQKEQNKTT